MNDKFSPLSEAELVELVEDIERGGTVSPPPELEEAVWQRLEENERRSRLAPRRRKLTPAEELRRYRLQVAASVAAAILLLFTLPSWEELRPTGSERDAKYTEAQRGTDAADYTERLFDWNGGHS